MQAHDLNRGTAASPASCGRFLTAACILAGCVLANPGFVRCQANQSAPAQTTPQQNPKPAAQQPARNPAPASGQAPAAGPMVIGDNPDSTQGTDGAPAAPAAKQSSPPASPATRPLVRWTPGTLAAGDSSAPAAPAAAPGPAASPALSPAVPVPPPADAGGDSARQQINNQCVDLLNMANDLKAAVDKSNKNVLSVAVVRKADEIEQLAHHVKDEMRPTVGKD